MTLPIDLVLVRHGQSEINKAKRLSETGDHSAFTKEFRRRHSASFRLTRKGLEQAQRAGAFLRDEFATVVPHFDRYYVSDYLRAMETAGGLGLPGALWFRDFYLTERDWGELDIYPEDERERKFMAELRRRRVEPFFWKPPNGESFAELCLRIDRVLHTLHRECSAERVIIVCHGEVMRAFQVRIERLSRERFRELVFSKDRWDTIYNGQIIHYTRRDPFYPTRPLLPHMGWVRWIRPTETPVTTSLWQPIVRPRYSNAELLEIVSRTPAMVE
jgi:NAD+ kinase